MENGRAQLVLLDHGLYEVIKDEDRRNLCSLWKAIVLKDEMQMQKYAGLLGVKGYFLIGTLKCST
jgi:aarF domain-containing kinase